MNSTLQKVMKPSVLAPLLTGVGTFAGGLAVGYFLGKRERKVIFVPNESEMAKIETDLEELTARREAREAAKLEGAIIEPKPEPDPKVTEFLRERAATGIDGPPVIARNVFAESTSEWDYEAEKLKRDSTEPYIIHEDEFHSRELGFMQQSFLYYAADDTLVDLSDGKPIYNRHEVTGDNLLFGHGSKSPETVFIRNEVRQEEYEVTYDEGSYTRDVLNLDEDEPIVQHSAPRRYRPEE